MCTRGPNAKYFVVTCFTVQLDVSNEKWPTEQQSVFVYKDSCVRKYVQNLSTHFLILCNMCIQQVYYFSVDALYAI
jgi:hypothetical protein